MVAIQLDTSAQYVLEALQKQGFEAYAVGGCVRDALMGNTPKDWDVCTSALPQQVIACFRAHTVIETGLQHGTVTVVVNGTPIEVTTYRVDGSYEDNRRPSDVQFVRSLREDLARRDFTMNALAYNPAAGLVDYYGGAADIQNKLIHCVGKPDERFNEDGLRIMRALRFASRFGFRLAEDTAQSIHSNRHLLRNISAERLNTELCGLLLGDAAVPVLRAYPDVLAVFIPELKPMFGFAQNNPWHQYDVWRHTVESVGAAPKDKTLRLTMLLHDIAKPCTYTTDEKGVGHFYGYPDKSAEIAQTILKRLRFDNETIADVCTLVRWHDVPIEEKTVIKWLARLGEARFFQLLQVKAADAAAQVESRREESMEHIAGLREKAEDILAQKQCFTLKDLALNGNDLIQAGYAPGVGIGETLHTLLNAVMEGTLPNEKAALIEKAGLLKG